MKQYILSCIGIVTMLVLIGAGCTTSTKNTPPATKDADTNTDVMMKDTLSDDTMDKDSMQLPATDIILTADARGERSVYFGWTIPEDTEYDGFIIVRGEEVDPTDDGVNFWFRQHYTRRAVTWTDLPAGNWHFRICGVIGEDCAVYSNDVAVLVR